jgi:hypothetical protein
MKKKVVGSRNRTSLAFVFLGLGLAILIIGPSLARSASIGNISRAISDRIHGTPPTASAQNSVPGENKSGEADDENLRDEYWAIRSSATGPPRRGFQYAGDGKDRKCRRRDGLSQLAFKLAVR